MLTIVLLDVRRLEILRVLDVVESLAKGLEAVGVVRRLRSASCVDDVPCIHNGIGYLFPVVPAVVVVAVWLRARSLICLWLATSGAMTTRSFLIILVYSVLLFLLLLTLLASGGTACLWYCCCGIP